MLRETTEQPLVYHFFVAGNGMVNISIHQRKIGCDWTHSQRANGPSYFQVKEPNVKVHIVFAGNRKLPLNFVSLFDSFSSEESKKKYAIGQNGT